MKTKSTILALCLGLFTFAAQAAEDFHGVWWKQGAFGAIGFVGPTNHGPGGALIGGSGSVTLAYVPVDKLAVGGGLILSRDGLGNWTSGVQAGFTYQMINAYPFSAGPEFIFTGFMTPGSFFNTTVYEPGWSFWYAPFKGVNLAFGGVFLGSFVVTNAGWTFKLDTPTLRAFYVFN